MRLPADVRRMFERAGRKGGRVRSERKLESDMMSLVAARRALEAMKIAAASAEQVAAKVRLKVVFMCGERRLQKSTGEEHGPMPSSGKVKLSRPREIKQGGMSRPALFRNPAHYAGISRRRLPSAEKSGWSSARRQMADNKARTHTFSHHTHERRTT
jgi:hypothetical protein